MEKEVKGEPAVFTRRRPERGCGWSSGTRLPGQHRPPGRNVEIRVSKPPTTVLAASWFVHHLPARFRHPSEMAGFQAEPS